MDVSNMVLERQERSSVLLEGLCRLCGGQESSKMLHISDSYSIGIAVKTTISHLLDNISALLKVQDECEEAMPKNVCMACFNTAVDIQAFIDSAVSFQKTTICQLFPNAKVEEVPELPLIPTDQNTFQNSSNIFQCSFGTQNKDELEDCESPSITVFGDDNFHYENISCQGDGGEKPLEVKGPGYNIISKLIDTPDGQSNISNCTETVIEISPGTEQTYIFQDIGNDGKCNENTDFDELQKTKVYNQIDNNSKCPTNEDDSKELTNVLEKPILSDNVNSEPIAVQTQQTEDNSKKCMTCGKEFSRKSQLKSHMTSHSENRPFECNVCHVKFKYQRNLVEHSSIHDDPPSFICSVCGLTFKQRSNLLKHERTHLKTSRQSFECKICSNRYSQSSHLKVHMRTSHGDNQGYPCDQCSTVLQCRSSLRRHQATVHATSSKYFCPHCSKGFNNTQNYQGHIRSHTGERPYCCNTCNKTFTTSKALSRHRLIHQRTKSHVCSECGKAFLELCDLKRHVKRHLLKHAKNASKQMASRNLENTNIPVQSVVPSMNSLNLMVLPDSILFTESQQLLDNSGSSSAEIILPHGKLNAVKTISDGPVLESALIQNTQYNIEPTSGPLSKNTNILGTEVVLGPTELLSNSRVNASNSVGTVPIIEAAAGTTSQEVINSTELLSSPQVNDSSNVEPVPILDPATVIQTPEVISGLDTSNSIDSSSVLQSDNIRVQDTIQIKDKGQRQSVSPNHSGAATMVVLSSVGTTSDYLPVDDHDSVIEGTRHQQSERVLSHATW